MIKEFIFKITKEQYVRIFAEDEASAYELIEEESIDDIQDEEIVDVELIDVYEDDIDCICDDYRLGLYCNQSNDMY